MAEPSIFREVSNNVDTIEDVRQYIGHMDEHSRGGGADLGADIYSESDAPGPFSSSSP
jgi:hypothetical protein